VEECAAKILRILEQRQRAKGVDPSQTLRLDGKKMMSPSVM